MTYLAGLVEDNLTCLSDLPQTDKRMFLPFNCLVMMWRKITLRIKKVGFRWSPQGEPRKLAATPHHVLWPGLYRKVEAQIRGERTPRAFLVITSLKPE